MYSSGFSSIVCGEKRLFYERIQLVKDEEKLALHPSGGKWVKTEETDSSFR